jgi:hypothetical protein
MGKICDVRERGKIFIGIWLGTGGERQHRGPGRRWENNIKIDLRVIILKHTYWTKDSG